MKKKTLGITDKKQIYSMFAGSGQNSAERSRVNSNEALGAGDDYDPM